MSKSTNRVTVLVHECKHLFSDVHIKLLHVKLKYISRVIYKGKDDVKAYGVVSVLEESKPFVDMSKNVCIL